MTSPVGDFEPFENEDEILGDQTVRNEDEEDGEELFGDNMENGMWQENPIAIWIWNVLYII